MTLLALQQDFRAWLTTEPSELPSQFSEQARPGLAVYLNNYRSQLLSCLSASFPVVRAWIGDAAFDGAAAHHIDRIPPHEWTLDAYGFDFPDTLETLYPGDPAIAELARLERELAAAFVGPDAEMVNPGTLTDIDWDAAVMHLAPTFTTLAVVTNVGAIWSALTAGETPPFATFLTERAALAIWRHNFAPTFRTVTADEADVLAQIRAGETFGSICARLVARLGEDQGAAIAGAFLSQWLSDGLIVHITARDSLKAFPDSDRRRARPYPR
jgi:putative DNA-binding protein